MVAADLIYFVCFEVECRFLKLQDTWQLKKNEASWALLAGQEKQPPLRDWMEICILWHRRHNCLKDYNSRMFIVPVVDADIEARSPDKRLPMVQDWMHLVLCNAPWSSSWWKAYTTRSRNSFSFSCYQASVWYFCKLGYCPIHIYPIVGVGLCLWNWCMIMLRTAFCIFRFALHIVLEFSLIAFIYTIIWFDWIECKKPFLVPQYT